MYSEECTTPTYDPFKVLHVSGCGTERYTTSDPFERVFTGGAARTRVSALASHCYSPCKAMFVTETSLLDEPWSLATFAAWLVCFALARRIARSRWTWIALGTALSVACSIMLLGYLLSAYTRSDRASTGAVWVGLLTLVASAQAYITYAAQATLMRDYYPWVMMYAWTFASLGFALAKAFAPRTVDGRVSDVAETLVRAASFVGMTRVHPSFMLVVGVCSTAALVWGALGPGDADARAELTPAEVATLRGVARRQNARREARRARGRSASPGPGATTHQPSRHDEQPTSKE